eukprot:SM000260S09933  [mRNA]  locus=s260:152288:154296:+ [translate_table: standard]
MFQLAAVEDTVRVAPRDLQLPHLVAVRAELRRAYIDKVIRDVGLVVALYDVQSVTGGFVYPGDGAPRFTVAFRLVVFRPFVGEVLLGKLRSADTSGLCRAFQLVSPPDWNSNCRLCGSSLLELAILQLLLHWLYDELMTMPDHIATAAGLLAALAAAARSNEEEELWVWRFGDNELFMDIDEEVRFRVAQVSFVPTPLEPEPGAPPFAPMRIVGDINADGLGLVSWWN